MDPSHFESGSLFTDDDIGDLEFDSVRDAKNQDDVKENEIRQVQELARTETERIRFWRKIVLSLLIVTGIVISCVAYLILIRKEDGDFRMEVSLSVRTNVCVQKRRCTALHCTAFLYLVASVLFCITMLHCIALLLHHNHSHTLAV
jgi:hypothetical protein